MGVIAANAAFGRAMTAGTLSNKLPQCVCSNCYVLIAVVSTAAARRHCARVGATAGCMYSARLLVHLLHGLNQGLLYIGAPCGR